MTSNDFFERQKTFCSEREIECMPVDEQSIAGFAVSTKGLMPLNGLRHPCVENSNGWFIWSGEDMSPADDFFSPVHTNHILEEYPQLTPILGLPPGYRFLTDGDHLDLWYDPLLLNV